MKKQIWNLLLLVFKGLDFDQIIIDYYQKNSNTVYSLFLPIGMVLKIEKAVLRELFLLYFPF